MLNPKVSIALLTWNNYKDTKECMESLEKINYPNYEIVVVDNGSKDGSIEKIKKEFPGHFYIYIKENLGCAGGINVGMKYAFENGADFIFFINNDMIVDKNFLWPLVNAMSDERVGLVGPATYCYPEVKKLQTAGRTMNYWKGGTNENGLPKKINEVECLGGCFLVKRDVVSKAGFFYEPYFCNFEETDYCMMAKKAGFKILCEPKSVIWHKVSITVGKGSAYNAYYGYRNRFLYVKRNYPRYAKWFFYFYYSTDVFLRLIKYKIENKENMAFALRCSLVDFFHGKFGENSTITLSKK